MRKVVLATSIAGTSITTEGGSRELCRRDPAGKRARVADCRRSAPAVLSPALTCGMSRNAKPARFRRA